ncbi:MAG: DUF1573 domain-containing protein [Candidatus Omnitrophica bacterium]|nr:DUF1573 domain-containing protein [Candidatus Omnitrophota bacterium]
MCRLRPLFLIPVCLLLFAGITDALAFRVAKAPRAMCEQPYYEFGEVPNTQTIENVFVVRNTGTATLEIRGIWTSCTCTDVEWEGEAVEPGGEIEILGRLVLHGREGKLLKEIFVETNDPQQQTLTLGFTGIALREVYVEPEAIFFGSVPQGATASAPVSIRTKKGTPYHIVSAVSTDPSFEAEVDSPERMAVHAIQIQLKAGGQPGKRQGRIKIRTDLMKIQEVEIPVSVRVMDDLLVEPREIVLDALSSGPSTHYLVLRRGRPKPFEVLKVETPDPQIEVNITPMGEDGYRIRLDNVYPMPSSDAIPLRIRTNIPGNEVIEVPFRITTIQKVE